MLLIFLIVLFASPNASLAKSVIAPSYAQHCSSIVPASSPTTLVFGASNSFLISNGFFSAGSPINNYLALSTTTNNSIHDSQSPGIFHFQPGQVHLTNDDGTRQLEGTLVLVGERVPRNMSKTTVWTRDFDKRRRVVFKLSGFLSETKGKLCMVGTGEIEPSQQDQVASQLSVVLKLEFPKVSTITTSIIKGSIESLDTDNTLAYFEPISLLAYAQRKYEYTMAEKAEESCSDLSWGEPVRSDSTICSILEKIMRYESFTSSDLIDFLGFRFLSVGQFVCRDDGKVHLSMALSNKTTYLSYGQPLLPEKSLVAEGVWDSHNSKLCLLACGVIGKEYNSAIVGDCSLGLTFWFPTSFTLKQRSTMVGRMWNTTDNSKNDGNKISVHSTDIYSGTDVLGLKYEYTELDRARKYCNNKNFDSKMTGRFPDAQSYMDMRFQFSVRGTKGREIWGQATQISTGEIYHGNQYGGFGNGDSMYTTRGTTIPSSSSLADQNRTIWNVGYTIGYTIWGGNYTDSVQISAEGIYNSTIGTLCLVGCRQPSFRRTRNHEILNSSARIDDRNLDCEFFIQFQLPPLDSKIEEGIGMITSKRADSDPLFFKPLKVSISLMYRGQSMQEFDRMDAEIIMVIISLTLLCACLYVQLRHARKNSTICPLMSITMLVVLTLGCMVPLILNTETMLVPARNRGDWRFFLGTGGWIDTVNTIARLITIVALLINFRLLQLAWGSRTKEEITGAISRSAEKKSLMFCFPLYTTGALVAWFVHSHFAELRRSRFYNHRTIFDDLARYVGLLADNFLLPQIIFSVFSQSKEKVLNPFFYFGVTVVRAAPHVYNAYRAWWYPVDLFNSSYIYANPDEDYYSKILDVIIPFGGLLFALIVYLQQRFGGRCFLPKRFKQGAGYELVYVSNI